MGSPLQPFLDRLYANYHRRQFLSSDPLEFAHRYSDPWDQEAVALLSAVLAYGNVKQIRRSVEDALGRIERAAGSPRRLAEWLAGDDEAARRGAREAFRGFVHRFNRGPELALLLELLGRSWREYGSLGAHFLRALEPGAPDFSDALNALIFDWRRWAGARARQGAFGYLLTAPADGSCCKRWCMLLRWMGRIEEGQSIHDRLDLGLWAEGSPLATTFPPGRVLRARQLVIPLDTHTGRISQYLGLTRRKSLNWKAAIEVTESLRACHAEDPVRYDFALARLGILDLCQRKYRAEICGRCELVKICRFAIAGGKRKRKAA